VWIRNVPSPRVVLPARPRRAERRPGGAVLSLTAREPLYEGGGGAALVAAGQGRGCKGEGAAASDDAFASAGLRRRRAAGAESRMTEFIRQ
jgi:hypothetical protein